MRGTESAAAAATLLSIVWSTLEPIDPVQGRITPARNQYTRNFVLARISFSLIAPARRVKLFVSAEVIEA